MMQPVAKVRVMNLDNDENLRLGVRDSSLSSNPPFLTAPSRRSTKTILSKKNSIPHTEGEAELDPLSRV